MRKDIQDADIQEGKVYLFPDAEVYTAEVDESFYNNNQFKYKTTHIDEKLTSLVYDEKVEVKFNSNYTAMEFSDAGHFNRFLQQEGYAEVKRLAKMVGLKLKDK